MSQPIGRPGNTQFLAQVYARAPNDAATDENGQYTADAVYAANPDLQSDDHNAVTRIVAASNSAGTSTPAATPNTPSGGTGAAGQIPENMLESVLQDINKAVADISAVEDGGTATLHWWGWELSLTETATKSFVELLSGDLTKLTTALGIGTVIVSPPLAGALAIFTIVTGAFATDITNTDTNGNGVTIKVRWFFPVPTVQAN